MCVRCLQCKHSAMCDPAGVPHQGADLGQDVPDLLVATPQAGTLQAGTQQVAVQNTHTAAAA